MLISVVVPIYNAEQWLSACLRSIENQTYGNLEVLLIDDGSQDHSGAICDSFSSRDPRFRTFHCPNQGVSAARNRGIRECSGDYVTFIDSDDYIADDYLQRMAEIAKQTSADTVVNSCYYADYNGIITRYAYTIHERTEIEGGELTEFLVKHHYPSALWMSLYKTAIVKNHLLDQRISFYEDLEYQLALSKSIARAAVNKEPGYYYRSGSETHKRLTGKTLSCYVLIDKLRDGQYPAKEEWIDQLECDMVISNALIGARDLHHEKSLDDVIKQHAVFLRKKGFLNGKYKAPYCWVHLIALSPALYFRFYRIRHRIR